MANIIKEAEKAFEVVETVYKPIWYDIFLLTIPSRAAALYDFTLSVQDDNIHDSTAGDAMMTLANIMLAGLTPPWTRWIKLVPGPLVRGEDRKALQERLEVVNDVIFNEINRSNFIQAIQPSLLDSIAGTGCILVEPDDLDGVSYINIPLGSFAIKENYKGEVAKVFHRQNLTGREIVDLFDYRGDIDLNEEYTITIAVENNKDTFYKTVFAEINENYEILEEAELDWQPYIVFRWMKVPGEAYGYGPARKTYFDNRYLNTVKENAAEGLSIAINGVYTAEDSGVVNPYTLTIQPGTVIPVVSNDRQRPSISRLDTATNINIAQFEIQTTRDDIRKGFLNDRFSPPTGEKFTATEIVMRARLIAQELGATYGLLEKELLRPIVATTIRILQKQKKLPEGILPNNKTIDVMYESELAKIQRMAEVQDIMQFASFLGMFSQFDQRSLLILKTNDVLYDVAEKMDVNSSYLRGKAEITNLIQQAQQQAQQQQQGKEQQPTNPQGVSQ